MCRIELALSGRIFIQPLLDLRNLLNGSLITEIFEKQFVCHLLKV